MSDSNNRNCRRNAANGEECGMKRDKEPFTVSRRPISLQDGGKPISGGFGQRGSMDQKSRSSTHTAHCELAKMARLSFLFPSVQFNFEGAKEREDAKALRMDVRRAFAGNRGRYSRPLFFLDPAPGFRFTARKPYSGKRGPSGRIYQVMENEHQPDKSRVLKVESEESWESFMAQAKSQGSPVVVHFSASWCVPSLSLNSFVEELATTYPDILFLLVDVDEVKEVAAKMKVKAMPTFIIFRDGSPVNRMVGANPGEIKKRIEALFNTQVLD
ncbi:hypothetical protein HPP92_005547 [Vanilla planifolia]|uniref:Thioredoxin domain-containing protein n=1 Tax=Vanilla planifolia TaxID=51239 RepID=A0A835RYZ9_VANPL|nr:hypothetical protein HPP92_005547 [Vanilla planifolia]